MAPAGQGLPELIQTSYYSIVVAWSTAPVVSVLVPSRIWSFFSGWAAVSTSICHLWAAHAALTTARCGS